MPPWNPGATCSIRRTARRRPLTSRYISLSQMAKHGECGYCNDPRGDIEREHVIAGCLYPASKAASRVQRITISACSACNHSWEDDEPHFRNVILMAGDSNSTTQELWPRAVRSFRQSDGPRRLLDVWHVVEPIQVEGIERLMIFPGRDERVLRVVRKIVRGLSYFHGLGKVVEDDHVLVDIMKYRLPEEFVASVEFQHREPDVFLYWFALLSKNAGASS